MLHDTAQDPLCTETCKGFPVAALQRKGMRLAQNSGWHSPALIPALWVGRDKLPGLHPCLDAKLRTSHNVRALSIAERLD